MKASFVFSRMSLACILAPIFTASVRSAQDVQIELSNSSAQIFLGWGVHPCDSDPAKENFHWFPDAMQLFRGLKIDIVKCIAKPECFRSYGNVGLNTAFIDESLVAQLLLMKQSGIDHYVLALEAPPKAFRRYYSDEGLVDMHLNELRQADEANYAQLLVSLVRYLVSKGVGKPDGLVIQGSANLKIQYGACVMDPPQLQRLSLAVRAELDRDAELSGTAIGGPDTLGYSASLDYIPQFAAKDTSSASYPVRLILVQPAGHRIDVNSWTKVVSSGNFGDRELWASGWAPLEALSDAAGVMQTIERLSDDFNLAGINRWFWSQAYFNERSPRGLIYGSGRPTGLYPLFAELTQRIRPGVRVLKLKVTGLPPTEMPALAFGDGSHAILVVGNSTNAKINFRLVIGNMKLKQASGDTLVPGNFEWNRKSIYIPGDKVTVPAQTVAVIELFSGKSSE